MSQTDSSDDSKSTDEQSQRSPAEETETCVVDLNKGFDAHGGIVTLVVGNTKIIVNKAVLGMASPVFAIMFEGDFKEKYASEIELPDKNAGDFKEFLECIYPNTLKPITRDNVWKILPFVDEYQVPHLNSICENVLLKMVTGSDTATYVYMFLEKACHYNMEKLKEHCTSLAAQLGPKQWAEIGAKLLLPLETKYDVVSRINENMSRKIEDLEVVVSRTNENMSRYLEELGVFKTISKILKNAEDKYCEQLLVLDKLPATLYGKSICLDGILGIIDDFECAGTQIKLCSFDFEIRFSSDSQYLKSTVSCDLNEGVNLQVRCRIVVLNKMTTMKHKYTDINTTLTASNHTINTTISRLSDLKGDQKGFLRNRHISIQVHLLVTVENK